MAHDSNDHIPQVGLDMKSHLTITNNCNSYLHLVICIFSLLPEEFQNLIRDNFRPNVGPAVNEPKQKPTHHMNGNNMNGASINGVK